MSRVTLVLRMISANLWCQPIRPAVTSVVFDFAGVPDGWHPDSGHFDGPSRTVGTRSTTIPLSPLCANISRMTKISISDDAAFEGI